MDERLKAASDAGKIGGEKIREKYGTAHFRAIGKKGGEATKAAHAIGNDYYERIGKLGGQKGGKSTSAKHGPAFYQGIGKRGGDKVKALIDAAKDARKAQAAAAASSVTAAAPEHADS
jgi:uncharacterized protein